MSTNEWKVVWRPPWWNLLQRYKHWKWRRERVEAMKNAADTFTPMYLRRVPKEDYFDPSKNLRIR